MIKRVLLLILCWPTVSAQAEKRLVSMTVGQVKEHVVTSREVLINQALELSLFPANKNKLQVEVESQGFAKEVGNILLEWMVFMEAKSVSADPPPVKEISLAIDKAKASLNQKDEWRRLKVTAAEMQLAVERKLTAQKFIQFKVDTSVVPVTDTEAEKYFETNRARFGNLPFEKFKDNIKTFLNRQQVDQRLKDWFEVLQAKYSVRNFLSEI